MNPDYDPLPRGMPMPNTPTPEMNVEITGTHLSNAEHIPDPIKKCLDRSTHREGWKTGLNDVILSKQPEFKSYMLMAGAKFTDNDLFVPHAPGTTEKYTQVGINNAVNVSDLNIFFGRINGAYGLPEK